MIGGVGGILFMDFFPQDVPIELQRLGGEVVQEIRTLDAPKGSLSTETNDGFPVTSVTRAAGSSDPGPTDWPGYNRTLDGDRYSPLTDITTENVDEGALHL